MLLPMHRGSGTGVADLVGQTPLVRLRSFERERPTVELYAKAEWRNPSGSVKDRAALAVIADGVRRGALTPDRAVLDATGANGGLALAMLGAAAGYRVTLCMPGSVPPRRRARIEALGARVVTTDTEAGPAGARDAARRLHEEAPDDYFFADQASNEAAWRAHHDGTGREIFEQTEGRITHVVAGLGTAATFTGVSRRLRELCRDREHDVAAIAVQPERPDHGLEGLRYPPADGWPPLYDASLVEADLTVGTDDAGRMARQLATDEGLLVGPSSGATLVAGLQVAEAIPGGVIVMIFCDGDAPDLRSDDADDPEGAGGPGADV